MQHVQNAALVVEPMPLIAAAAADSLVQLGFGHVELAAGVDAALDLIGRVRFDFALLSVVHREGSIARVAAMLDQAAVPYVLVSDLADGRDRPLELLGARYVTKPYCLSDLARILGRDVSPCTMR
ncbi:MAG: hypothetical protein WBL74_10705 [Novosphingobium sp.]|uniref:hypothetical protein n=1 Tax=Novosphingobium sp. TaxID=1874826 RepID=UPI003C7B586E